MARLNIEESFWTSPRLKKLSKLIGEFAAIGAAVQLWKVSQEYWKHDKLIPEEVFELNDFPEELFDVGLAIRKEDGIYARGSNKHFEWLVKRVDASRKGGQANKERWENKNNNLRKPNDSQAKPSESPLPLPLPLTLKNILSSKPDFTSEVIEHLNNVSGSQFKSKAKATTSLIEARRKEGFTLDDFKKVIESQHSKWDGTDWAKYLRPSTLFNASKFEGYLQDARPKQVPSEITPGMSPEQAMDVVARKYGIS